ncbi:MAG TPA: hypothetical protein VGZ33_07445 [Acidimicrobiales bacterium]|jgi:hypothetical protein|nr:hypothetical protein [Acidimicrobiales bacterium]
MGASELLGAASLIETVVEILVFVVLFGVLAILFIVAIGNRTDQDPTGSRPIAAYLFSASFLFLWIAYFGIDVAANSLINLVGSHPGAPSSNFLPIFVPTYSYRDAAIRACVLGGILVVLVGGAWVLHLRRGTALAEAETNPSGPTKRVMRTYVALVSFVSIIVMVLALAVAVWMAFGLLSPTIFLANASRTVTLRGVLDALVLVVLGGAIFSYHQRFAPEGLRLLSSVGGGRRDAADHAEPPAPQPAPSS